MKQNKSSRTLSQINNAVKSTGLEPLESDSLSILTSEIDKIKDIKLFWSSDGGQIVLSVLKNNCQSSLVRLMQYAQQSPNLDILLSCIHEYKANIDLLSTLSRTTSEEEIQKQID